MKTFNRIERYVVIPALIIIFAYFLGLSLKELQANEPPVVTEECFDSVAFVKIEDGKVITRPEKICVLKWQDKEYIEKKHKML